MPKITTIDANDRIEISRYPEGGWLARAILWRDIALGQTEPRIFIGIGTRPSTALGDVMQNPEFQEEIGITIKFLPDEEDRDMGGLLTP